MKRRSTTTTNRAFNVVAVDRVGETLLGVVRMNAYKKPVRVRGISAWFQTTPEDIELYLTPQQMFFYGTATDLEFNFTRDIPEDLPLEDFLDRGFGSGKHKYRPHRGKRPEIDLRYRDGFFDGFFRIPLEEISLGTSQQTLLESLLEKLPQALPDLLQHLERIEITEADAARSNLGKNLTVFPQELREAVIRERSYYKTYTKRKDQETTTIQVPIPRIVSTPTGGLPDWARTYVRKHR